MIKMCFQGPTACAPFCGLPGYRATGLPGYWLPVAGAQSDVPIKSLASAATTAGRPAVVELFTSQGCSSCPPADALVAELAEARPDLLVLTFHVTYWNNLGWQDPFSFQAATERQRRYVALSVSPQVYTPAMVIDGQLDVVGSDRPAVAAALVRARAGQTTSAAVSLTRWANTISVSVGSGVGGGKVVLLGYDKLHRTQVGRDENSGRTLREANIVRSVAEIGSWTGAPARFDYQAPTGEMVALLVQAADGRILGAARESNGS